MATLLSKWRDARKKRQEANQAISQQVQMTLAAEWSEGHRRRQQEQRNRASEVRGLQQETKEFLSEKNQERKQMKAEQQKKLAVFRAELDKYSQNKKAQVQQMRAQNQKELSELSSQLQSELHQDRGNLRISVWGTNEEALVYDCCIQNRGGVRITEIEETLGITRVKAVDTVKSLMQQGLIVERDQLFFLR